MERIEAVEVLIPYQEIPAIRKVNKHQQFVKKKRGELTSSPYKSYS